MVLMTIQPLNHAEAKRVGTCACRVVAAPCGVGSCLASRTRTESDLSPKLLQFTAQCFPSGKGFVDERKLAKLTPNNQFTGLSSGVA